jgi:hypothetical protein
MLRHAIRSLSLVALAPILAACATGAPAPVSTPTPAVAPTTAPQPTGWPGWQLPADGGELVPIPVSSELAVGENRFLLNLVDTQNEPLASPDRPVSLRFFDLAEDPAAPALTVDADYLPTIPQLPGLYRAMVEFDRPGPWGIEAVATEADGSARTGRMIFSVLEQTSTPPLGAQAPETDTPTAQTPAEIAAISTDRHPDASFYRTSVADALAQDRPFLLFFGTPAFCRTAVCGPVMEILKDVAPEFDGQVEVIHVEPYELHEVDGNLQPVLEGGQLVPVPSVIEWGLRTEPMIFAVDADGRVTAKLEGVASAQELRAAMAEIAD